MFVAIVLDPRHKFEKLVDYFEVVFREVDDRVESITFGVKELLHDLYKMYEEEGNLGESVCGSYEPNDEIPIMRKSLTEMQRNPRSLTMMWIDILVIL